MRSQYVSSPDAYVNYFIEQTGGGQNSAIFKGVRIQRGYGLGSIFSRMFRFAMPLFKRGVKHVAKTAGKTGVSFLTDAVSGANLKESAKSHLKSMGKSLAGDAAEYVTDRLANDNNESRDENQTGGTARFAWFPKNLGTRNVTSAQKNFAQKNFAQKRGRKRKRTNKKNHSGARHKRSKLDALTSSSVF
jgi:hypothetical protein